MSEAQTTRAPASEQTPREYRQPKYEAISQWRMIWRRFRQHQIGMAGMAFLGVLFFILLFAEFFSPYDYNVRRLAYVKHPPMIGRIHFVSDEGFSLRPFVYGIRYIAANIRRGERERFEEDSSQKYYIRFFVRGDEYSFWGLFKTNLHFFGTGEAFEAPGQIFLFGTDRLGQDIFTRTLIGGRVTLLIGIIVILLSFSIGVPLGGISGYYGGKVDTVIQKAIEALMALPRLALLLALSLFLSAYQLGPTARMWGIALMLAFVSWAPIARVIRGQFLALREEDFVTAAQALGAGDLRVILKHILPNTMSFLVVTATLTVPNVIITESILSFLGYGIRHPMVSWGMLLSDAQQIEVLQFTPWFLIPGLFIVATVLVFNFIGDALRDAVDPFTVVAARDK